MLYGVFFTLVVPIYNRLKEAMRPVIFEPTASALSVAFVDYIIFGVYFRQLVSAATIIASANAVVFYFISHNYISPMYCICLIKAVCPIEYPLPARCLHIT